MFQCLFSVQQLVPPYKNDNVNYACSFHASSLSSNRVFLHIEALQIQNQTQLFNSKRGKQVKLFLNSPFRTPEKVALVPLLCSLSILEALELRRSIPRTL